MHWTCMRCGREWEASGWNPSDVNGALEGVIEGMWHGHAVEAIVDGERTVKLIDMCDGDVVRMWDWADVGAFARWMVHGGDAHARGGAK